MKRKLLLILLLFVSTLKTFAQGEKPAFLIGISTGFGSEFNNSDYTFSNQFYKLQLYYVIKETNHFQYEILIQPEINFAKHQLLNFYFVKPETPDFEQKRDEYTKLKNVREYALNLGFLIRKSILNLVLFIFWEVLARW